MAHWNYYVDQLPPGKTPLRINLDETSVCILQGDCHGTVFVNTKRPKDEPVKRMARATRRCWLTHVASIRDDSVMQPVLLQVVRGSEHTFPKAGFAELQAVTFASILAARQYSWHAASIPELGRGIGQLSVTPASLPFLWLAGSPRFGTWISGWQFRFLCRGVQPRRLPDEQMSR